MPHPMNKIFCVVFDSADKSGILTSSLKVLLDSDLDKICQKKKSWLEF